MRSQLVLIAALAITAALVVFLPGLPAAAAGPGLAMGKDAPASALAGGSFGYSLTASNPDQPDAVPEYNVTFRDELPVGLTYTPGSTSPGTLGEPTIIVDPDDGHQTLLWINLFDLPPGSSKTLDFEVEMDPDVYTVGTPVVNSSDVYAHSDPRTLPMFDDAGDPVDGTYTESANSPDATTEITAINATKGVEAPELELLRGVHEHSTVYTLKAINNSVAATDDVVLVDYLPAGLEFLGCGDVDNSTDVEYPGAPRLTEVPNVVTDCRVPDSVETVTNPDGRPFGTYTRLQWNLGSLDVDEEVRIRYRAGIPQRKNTASFPDGASDEHTANLDNNTGESTRELDTEETITNVVTATGTYSGPVAPGADPEVSDNGAVGVTIEDVAVQKGVAPGQFSPGGIATYTLTVSLSEYTDATDIVIKDVLPDGLCPLSATTNFEPSGAADCAPEAGFEPTGAEFTDVVPNDAGGYDITFSPLAGPQNEVLTVTYQARMRRVFRETGLPTVSGDDYVNTVGLEGETTPNAAVDSPDEGPQAVTDDSSAAIGTDGPALQKLIQPDDTPHECSSDPAAYIDPLVDTEADVTFDEGSRVCFLLRLDFSSTNFTRNPRLVDFLPLYVTYEEDSAVISDGSEPAELVNTDPLRWNIGTPQGNSRYAEDGGFFEVRFSGIVTEPAPGPPPDITANLAKFAWQNTKGSTFGLRDQADLLVEAIPPASMEKSATRDDESPLADRGSVVADEFLRYTVSVGNDGLAQDDNELDIVGPDVWDVLPPDVTCDRVSEISPPGACTDPGDQDHPTFTERDSRSAIRWDLPDTVVLAPGDTEDLTYRMQVPTGASVEAEYTNVASVASYGTVNNLGEVEQHYPEGNVDTTVEPDMIDVAEATDDFTVLIPEAELMKSADTAITEPGNNALTAVAGELVTYDIDVTIPANTNLYEGKLTDTLPDGVEFVSAAGELSTDNGVTFEALPDGFLLDETDGTLTFPAAYATGDGDDHVARVTIIARVTNEESNTHGLGRVNRATLTSVNGAGGDPITPKTADARINIGVPVPLLSKDNDDEDGIIGIGQEVTYTLTAGNAAGRPTAHDMFVVDCVPADLVVTGIVAASQGEAAFGPATGADGCAEGTTRIEWNVGDAEPGAEHTLNYTATLQDTAAGGQVITNNAAQSASTLDDDKAAAGDDDNELERVLTNDATDTVTVRGAGVAKEVDSPVHTIGERATYTLTAVLPADVNFYDAAVIDNLPAALDLNSLETESVTCENEDGSECIVGDTELTPSGRTIGWGLGDVATSPDNRTVTIVYSAVVEDVADNVRGDTAINTAHVQWDLVDGDDPTSADETADNTTEPVSATVTLTEPDLTIDKSVSDTTPEPGETFDYTVDVTNTAEANVSDAHNITVVDTVPDGVVVDPDSISDDGVLTDASPTGGGTITWELPGPLASGSTLPLTYYASLASPTLVVALTNTADITRYTSTAEGGREYDGPEATATVTAALPHVSIEKAVVDGDVAYLDEPKTWRVTVTSDGDATALGVDVEDVLPANWLYDAGSAQVVVDGAAPTQTDPETSLDGAVQTLTWTDLADLPTKTTLVVTFTATPQPDAVDDPGAGSDIDHVNVASTTAEDADGNQEPADGEPYNGGPASAIAHIHAADVAIDKSHTGEPVAGSPFEWTITVSNIGPDTAVGPFVVTDSIPDELTGASASGEGWSCSASATEITCTRTDVADTLASGDSFPAITIATDVPADIVAGTELINVASVTHRTYDPDETNNEDEDTVSTAAKADLAIDKELSGPMIAGAPATYTLDVTNLGPSISRGEIVVTDTLPAGTSFVSAEGAGWDCSEDAGEVTCTTPGPAELGPLAQIAITIDIPSDQIADVENVATVDGPLDENPKNDTDTVVTTPQTQADLGIEKESVDEFVAGESGTYRFSIVNNGPSDALAPTITDTLPDMLTFADFSSVTGDWDCAAAGQVVTCDLSDPLPVGGEAVVDIEVDIDSTHTGDITNAAAVSSETEDPNPENDEDTDNTGVGTRADLAIKKSHTGEVIAGEQVTYDLTVVNNGPSLSPETVSVADVLPEGMTFAAFAGDSWDCTADGQVITCDLTGSLGSGATAPPLSITADVAPDAGPATLVNSATVDGPLPDPNLNNNDAQDPTKIVDRANIKLAKTLVSDNPATAGEETTFEIVVHNDGPSVADSVGVVDALPAGLTLVSASGPGWTCDADAPVQCQRDFIGADSDAPPITVIALVGSGVLDGETLVNEATARTATDGDDLEDNTDDASVDVQARADLALVKTHTGDDVVAGTSTTFTIGVTNNGPSDAVRPLTVTDTLPEGLSYLSVSGGWTCAADASDVTCTWPDALIAGGSAPDLKLLVQLDAAVTPQDLVNSATVESPTVDPVDENNTDIAEITTVQNADLSITKTHSGIGLVGEEMPFTLQVENLGPSEARNVVVTDTLPEGLELVSIEGDGWTCETVDAVSTCTLDEPLAPDTSAPPIVVTTLVLASAYPSVINATDVVSDATDLFLDDNEATDELEVAPLVNLTIDKRHEGDFTVGDEGTFTLEIANEGPTPAPGPITVVDTLPAGLTYVSATGDGWTCAEESSTVTCERDTMAVDETSEIALVVAVEPSAYPSVLNVATVGSDSTETSQEDNSAEDPVTVIPLVELALEKELVSITTSEAVFDLTVTNNGPNNTVGTIVITDPLPAGLEYDKASGPGWNCANAGRTVTCTTDQTLAVDEDSTVRLITKVTAKQGSTVVNVATVEGGGSTSPVEDDATGDVPVIPRADAGSGLGDTGGPGIWVLLAGVLLALAGGGLMIASRRGRSAA